MKSTIFNRIPQHKNSMHPFSSIFCTLWCILEMIQRLNTCTAIIWKLQRLRMSNKRNMINEVELQDIFVWETHRSVSNFSVLRTKQISSMLRFAMYEYFLWFLLKQINFSVTLWLIRYGQHDRIPPGHHFMVSSNNVSGIVCYF